MINIDSLNIIAKKESSLITNSSRLTLLAMINYMGLRNSAVEVGTYYGSFSYSLLSLTNFSKLYCVDPYMKYEEFEDAINTEDLEKVFLAANSLLSVHSERYKFLRMRSEFAAAEIPDNSLDFVYIDGNHKFSYALNDMEIWYPKVRTGGLLALDDCIDLDESNRDENGDIMVVHSRHEDGTPKYWGKYGVRHALHKFSEKNNLKYGLIGSQGYLVKNT